MPVTKPYLQSLEIQTKKTPSVKLIKLNNSPTLTIKAISIGIKSPITNLRSTIVLKSNLIFN